MCYVILLQDIIHHHMIQSMELFYEDSTLLESAWLPYNENAFFPLEFFKSHLLSAQ